MALIITSQDLLLPMRVSQWVMGIWVPSVILSHAQISGSRRKVSRGSTHRISSSKEITGTARRRKLIYSDTTRPASTLRPCSSISMCLIQLNTETAILVSGNISTIHGLIILGIIPPRQIHIWDCSV